MIDDANIGMWLLAAGQVGTVILTWAKLSGRSEKREIQQPLVVKASSEFASKDHTHPDYMTKGDCRQFHVDARAADEDQKSVMRRQLDHFGLKLDTALAEHNRHAEERANAIHGRISSLIPNIAAVEARLEDHIEDHRRTTHG